MTGGVQRSSLEIRARDGFALAATLMSPEGTRAGADMDAPFVVINSATGVGRGFYDAYARYLAGRGGAALSYDYRGVGDSRPGHVRTIRATLTEWATQDYAGVVDWVRAHIRPARLAVVAHSAGGQLLGLTEATAHVSAVLGVAVQEAYWGHYSGLTRLKYAAFCHVLMPFLSRVCGYLPAERLGIGADLPAGVGLEWARWARTPRYLDLAPHRDFASPMRLYSVDDDVIAPRRAVARLGEAYRACAVEHRHLVPREHGVDRIGHFGFFRSVFRDTLWADSADWLVTHTR